MIVKATQSKLNVNLFRQLYPVHVAAVASVPNCNRQTIIGTVLLPGLSLRNPIHASYVIHANARQLHIVWDCYKSFNSCAVWRHSGLRFISMIPDGICLNALMLHVTTLSPHVSHALWMSPGSWDALSSWLMCWVSHARTAREIMIANPWSGLSNTSASNYLYQPLLCRQVFLSPYLQGQYPRLQVMLSSKCSVSWVSIHVIKPLCIMSSLSADMNLRSLRHSTPAFYR